ncbi:ABC-2 transporter permease [Betaproteobacteria bacterium PRO4]|uniref:ABC transporter permease n=1 Tax=Nitrosomonas sp. TaxID=42353 RepID=UPI00256643B7|nr:ABC transporter permease [Nitrosomonas sp.]MBE7526448.1 ABC transporter permease [Burkholderiales bacterium]MDL1866295.1 ABC-2 transporter permease [Betaproteobacteria bacterium PRO4]
MSCHDFRTMLIRLHAQFIKELLCILRDPRNRVVVFVPPLLQLLIFSYAATLEVRNVDIAVYNQDTGREAQEFVWHLEAARFIAQVHHVHSNTALREQLAQGKVIAAITLPADFSRSIAISGSGHVQVLIDGRRSNSGQIVMGYLSSIARDIRFTADTLPVPETSIAVRHWFNPDLDYLWFIVPGLTGTLAFFSALMITALSIARERELGTFDQLLVSPASTLEIVLSKSLPALVISTLLAFLMIAMAIWFFRIPFTGAFGLLLIGLVLFVLSAVGIGLVISAISMTQQQAILGGFVIGVPTVLISGFATPVENMPVLLQWLAQAIPLTHFLIIIEGCFLKALPPRDILDHLWPLAIIALAALPMAMIFARNRLQ